MALNKAVHSAVVVEQQPGIPELGGSNLASYRAFSIFFPTILSFLNWKGRAINQAPLEAA